eukprot:353665-Hanusia_phi.AAC.1
MISEALSELGKLRPAGLKSLVVGRGPGSRRRSAVTVTLASEKPQAHWQFGEEADSYVIHLSSRFPKLTVRNFRTVPRNPAEPRNRSEVPGTVGNRVQGEPPGPSRRSFSKVKLVTVSRRTVTVRFNCHVTGSRSRGARPRPPKDSWQSDLSSVKCHARFAARPHCQTQ